MEKMKEMAASAKLMARQSNEPRITPLVVDYALGTCGLHRVSLGVYDFNPRAQRVYEKCGFSHEGRLRDALRWKGKWHDELLMAILSSDPGRPTDPSHYAILYDIVGWPRRNLLALRWSGPLAFLH